MVHAELQRGPHPGQVLVGELRLSAGDGAEPWIDTEDVAAVVVVTALLDEKHTGQTYSPPGPRTLVLTEVAAELSAATGRQIRYVDLELAAVLVLLHFEHHRTT